MPDSIVFFLLGCQALPLMLGMTQASPARLGTSLTHLGQAAWNCPHGSKLTLETLAIHMAPGGGGESGVRLLASTHLPHSLLGLCCSWGSSPCLGPALGATTWPWR